MLADAGFGSEAVFEPLAQWPIHLVVAWERKGESQLKIDERKYPRTAEMPRKLQTGSGKYA